MIVADEQASPRQRHTGSSPLRVDGRACLTAGRTAHCAAVRWPIPSASTTERGTDSRQRRKAR